MYEYEKEKPRIFEQENQGDFLKTRDKVRELLGIAGAFLAQNAMVAGSDSWLRLAYIDRLVELGEIREVKREVAGQYRLFVAQ